MKIYQINNVYHNNSQSVVKSKKKNYLQQQTNQPTDVNFKGKLGAILGGTLGVITIAATGGLALPFMGAIGAIGTATTIATGAIGGSALENAAKKNIK